MAGTKALFCVQGWVKIVGASRQDLMQGLYADMTRRWYVPLLHRLCSQDAVNRNLLYMPQLQLALQVNM